MQNTLGPREGSDAEEAMCDIAYYLWPSPSLGVIVVGGSFWLLIGREAAHERMALPGNNGHG
ncbi:hypothetical protein [Arthrobacter sp. TMS1-12-1]